MANLDVVFDMLQSKSSWLLYPLDSMLMKVGNGESRVTNEEISML